MCITSFAAGLLDRPESFGVWFTMDFVAKNGAAAALFALTLLLNVPFGYLRSRTERFSFRWFLFIHLTIPFVFVARLFSHLDYRYIPLFLLAAVAGQVMGGKLEP